MSQEFTERLETALAKRADRLQSHELNSLKEELRTYQTAFEGLTDLLHRNAVITEDPYGNEHKIGSISTPDNTPVSENDKETKLSSRLSFYRAMLDFVNNYYQFNLDMLTIAELRQLGEMVMFWKWSKLSPNAEHYDTQLLGQFVQRLKSISESMAAGIVQENLNQLAKSQRNIASILKTLTQYHRERYKLQIRKYVTQRMELEMVEPGQVDGVVSQVKRQYKGSEIQEPFYPELVREVIEEDCTETGEETRELKLQGLGEEQKRKNKQKEDDDSLKKSLLEAVRAIAASSRHLEEAVGKLRETSEAYQSRHRSLWARIKRWLIKSAQGEAPATTYTVTYSDITTSAEHKEVVDFDALMHKIDHKSRQLAAIQTPNSRAAARIDSASEEQILAFLTKTIEQVQMYHRTLNALDQYFKTHMPAEQKSRIRGVKIELSNIRTSITNANQLRQDYVSLKEEREQMRKLGVEDDE